MSTLKRVALPFHFRMVGPDGVDSLFLDFGNKLLQHLPHLDQVCLLASRHSYMEFDRKRAPNGFRWVYLNYKDHGSAGVWPRGIEKTSFTDV